MIEDLTTFMTKAIPDTKLTLKKYLDVKFTYLVRHGGPQLLMCTYFIAVNNMVNSVRNWISLLQFEDFICMELT